MINDAIRRDRAACMESIDGDRRTRVYFKLHLSQSFVGYRVREYHRLLARSPESSGNEDKYFRTYVLNSALDIMSSLLVSGALNSS